MLSHIQVMSLGHLNCGTALSSNADEVKKLSIFLIITPLPFLMRIKEAYETAMLRMSVFPWVSPFGILNFEPVYQEVCSQRYSI
jgi:hypothetical protein